MVAPVRYFLIGYDWENMEITGVHSIPFHIGDFLSGTIHMDTLEKGAYIMLILSHYQRGAEGLANDDKQLSRICGVTPKVWARIRPVMQEKFKVTDTHWTSQKIIDVLQEIHLKSHKQRQRAMKKNCPKVEKNDSRRETKTIPDVDAKSLKNKEVELAAAKPRLCQPKPKPKPILSKDNIKGIFSLDFEVWNEWEAYRKDEGKPLSKATAEKQILQLKEWHDQGHDVNAIINKSIMQGWMGLFEPKGEEINESRGTKTQRADDAVRELYAEYGIEG